MPHKVAVFIYEPLSGDVSRAYRGLKTALEFVSAGDDVAVVFDGSGVETLAAISQPAHKWNKILAAIHDSVAGACAFCAVSHAVKDPIVAAGFALLDDFDGEVGVRKFVSEGYTILNF